MRKKIVIALLALLLPAFLFINLIAEEPQTDYEDQVEVNNDILIDSPLFTSKAADTKSNPVSCTSSLIMDGFEKVASNSNLELWTNEDNGAIRIKTKNGYVWASDITDIEDFSFNNVQKRKARAAFEMSFRDEKNRTQTTNSAENDIKIRVKNSGNVVTYSVNNQKAKIQFKYTITLTDTGYVFVPSGNGGLIRFDENPAINSVYSQTYYGTDANRNRNTEGANLSLPIYGVTHGIKQNAMLTRIKSGSGFATFNYSPSSTSQYTKISTGVTQGFHMVYNTFTYRQTYSITIPGAESILMIPEDFYQEDVEVSYTFLSGEDADYIGMAKAYRNELVSEGKLKLSSNAGSGNVHVDVLGGETEKGIILDKFVKMTTTKQLSSINDELTKRFNNHFMYTLRGFYNDGYSRQSATNNKFDSSLGRLGDISHLDYYLYYNPVETYGSTKDSQPNKVLVNIFNEKHYVTMETETKYKYYTGVDTVVSGVNSTLNKYKNAVAIDALGYRLYGDHNSEYTRQDVLNKYSDLLTVSVPMFKPNEYFLANTSSYLNMSLYHERLRFITDSVPFLQIALRGYVDYYSTFINFSTNQEIDVLKCIEYGSNLAYLISYEESYKLANTLSSHLYATNFESNKAQMYEQINYAGIVLNDIKGQQIVDRRIVETGIVEVTYENNYKVYVNYTDSNYTTDSGVVVASMNYKVVK